MEIDEGQFETISKLAKSISLSEHTIRRRLTRGEIRGFKFGRDWFISHEEVEQLRAEYPV